MQLGQDHEPFWKRHLDKIGVGGSLFAALCCLGFPALLAILSAVGLGFLVNDAVLIPLLVLFLLVTLWGLYLGQAPSWELDAVLHWYGGRCVEFRIDLVWERIARGRGNIGADRGELAQRLAPHEAAQEQLIPLFLMPWAIQFPILNRFRHL